MASCAYGDKGCSKARNSVLRPWVRVFGLGKMRDEGGGVKEVFRALKEIQHRLQYFML